MLKYVTFLPLVLGAAMLSGQSNAIEDFDLTGLPPHPTNFAEQLLMEKIERHKQGDLRDAEVIQEKLAAYYRQKGDTQRARTAAERAQTVSVAQPGSAPPSISPQSIAGDYLCRSMGSGPCDTQTTITLREDGAWSWRYFAGRYKVNGNRVTFEGTGLGSWGPANLGPNTLTFNSGGQNVVWEKPSPAPPMPAGTYVCATAAGGGPCQTDHAIEIRPDGTWLWGVQRGSYSILGRQAKFSGGLTGGPAYWGVAEIGGGVLVFQSAYGPSEWKER